MITDIVQPHKHFHKATSLANVMSLQQRPDVPNSKYHVPGKKYKKLFESKVSLVLGITAPPSRLPENTFLSMERLVVFEQKRHQSLGMDITKPHLPTRLSCKPNTNFRINIFFYKNAC